MKRHAFTIFALPLIAALSVAGCATTRARKPDAKDAAAQVETLQSELAAKDQQIQDLQYQLDSYQQSIPSSGNYSSGSSSKSAVIKVAGVTVKDVQKALSRAGFDPGPIDGRVGRKTKAAIKDFQRRNNLKADGIVGERTWARLNG